MKGKGGGGISTAFMNSGVLRGRGTSFPFPNWFLARCNDGNLGEMGRAAGVGKEDNERGALTVGDRGRGAGVCCCWVGVQLGDRQ